MAKMAKQEEEQGVSERRVIRSHYLAIKNLIYVEKDDITSVESDKFATIINEVETLHHLVKKPREQVADAEALLDIANTLVTSVRSQTNEGVTPSDFVTALLRNFGHIDGMPKLEDVGPCAIGFDWAEVGPAVFRAFRNVSGCCTMIGPMKTEMKKHKPILRSASASKRKRPTESTRPEELNGTEEKGMLDTDKNMVAVFEILRKKRCAKLEALVLNRTSFAQTVENIFALSFLVKDGRAEITMNDAGHHLVSPRNAPAATAVTSGQASFHHFVFKFDYKDWKLMSDSVGVGEELMPHRHYMNTFAVGYSQAPNQTQMHGGSQATTTPIRKFSRNHGLVIQDNSSIGNYSPEEDICGSQPRKRRLFG